MPLDLPSDPCPTTPDVQAPEGLQTGLTLALQAEETGNWAALVDWMSRHPHLAGEIASFLAGQRHLPRPAQWLAGDIRGTVLGGLEVREEIGRGGMGVVYRAFDPRLRREVALKRVLAGPGLSPEVAARFRFEAEAAASLDHPAVVRVHTFGEEGGAPYLVMPLMEGGSLAHRLRDLGPDRCLPPAEAARLVRDVSLGVHHAHQHGLLHRDLKPANILLDRAGQPHVADFGLAWQLEVSLSGSGTIAGTAAYMAPEQARGERHLTTATDLHALGAILYELLTGTPPFGEGDLPTLLRRVQEDPPPLLRQRRPDVPADLEAICLRCLQKAPEDRYPSAQALADDLTRFLAGEPVGQPGSGLLRTLARTVGQRRETLAMTSWPTAYWGAGSTLLAFAALQAAVLLDSPAAVVAGILGYYFAAWFLILWVFLVARRDRLNLVERGSLAIQFGMLFAGLALLAGLAGLLQGYPLTVIQPLGVVLALGIFAHGFLFWGRMYVIGGCLLAAFAALPLVPVPFWPGIYGLIAGGFQLWAGWLLRRIDQASQTRLAPPPTGSPPS